MPQKTSENQVDFIYGLPFATTNYDKQWDPLWPLLLAIYI